MSYIIAGRVLPFAIPTGIILSDEENRVVVTEAAKEKAEVVKNKYALLQSTLFPGPIQNFLQQKNLYVYSTDRVEFAEDYASPDGIDKTVTPVVNGKVVTSADDKEEAKITTFQQLVDEMKIWGQTKNEESCETLQQHASTVQNQLENVKKSYNDLKIDDVKQQLKTTSEDMQVLGTDKLAEGYERVQSVKDETLTNTTSYLWERQEAAQDFWQEKYTDACQYVSGNQKQFHEKLQDDFGWALVAHEKAVSVGTVAKDSATEVGGTLYNYWFPETKKGGGHEDTVNGFQ